MTEFPSPCTCHFKPRHTRRVCRNPICWNCGAKHPHQTCQRPMPDQNMMARLDQGYRFQDDQISLHLEGEPPQPCYVGSQAIKALTDHFQGRTNVLLGLDIHRFLKRMVSTELGDNVGLMALDIRWSLPNETRMLSIVDLFSIPIEVSVFKGHKVLL